MEYKIDDLSSSFEAKLTQTVNTNSISMRINGEEHVINLLRIGPDGIEFILDNSFHHAKILQSTTAQAKLLIDGQTVIVKKHSKLTEFLEKSLSFRSSGGGENNLTSQIPGRVVSILAKAGSSVKKGDALIILESMKMQVAIKAHKDGNVKEIRIKEGATVARQETVAVIE